MTVEVRGDVRERKAWTKEVRKRLEEYMGRSGEKEEARREEENREKEQIYEEFIRKNLEKGGVWSWHLREVEVEREEEGEGHWTWRAREKVVERIMEDTVEKREYNEWLAGLKVVKVTAETPVVYTRAVERKLENERIEKEKLEREKAAEEEKNKKGAKGVKVDTKKEKEKEKEKEKKGKGKGEKETEEKQVEELKNSSLLKVKQEAQKKPDPPKPTKWRLFEIIEKQIKALPVECLTGGVYLEAFADEIEARGTGGLTSKTSDVLEDRELLSYLDSVLGSLLSAK